MSTRIRSRKVNKAWLNEHLSDPYVKQAQREGYRSRAAYKLKEIDEALRLLHPGQLVVDLGAAPGAWSQYVRRRLGPVEPVRVEGTAPAVRSLVIALDLLDFEPLEGVVSVSGDLRDDAVLDRLESALGGRPVDVVLSDMAPNLSGIPASDSARMADLVELAIDFASRCLAPEGAFVCKAFHGSGYSQLVERLKSVFRTVRPIKPKASRGRSAETFLVGIGLKTVKAGTDIRS